MVRSYLGILEAAKGIFNETAIRRRASWTGPRVRTVLKTLTTVPPTARSDWMSVVPRSVFRIPGGVKRQSCGALRD